MLLTVARIGRAHGIRGEVAVQVHTDDPDRRLAVGARLLTDPPGPGPLTIVAARWHSGRLLLGLAGVTDRDAAERLRGVRMLVDVADEELCTDDDGFYDFQLIGMTAELASGLRLGTVADVLHLPGQDVLVIDVPAVAAESTPADPVQADPVLESRGQVDPGQVDPAGAGLQEPAQIPQAPREVLVPFVSAIVATVDVRGRRVVIDPPPGLLDLTQAEDG